MRALNAGTALSGPVRESKKNRCRARKVAITGTLEHPEVKSAPQEVAN